MLLSNRGSGHRIALTSIAGPLAWVARTAYGLLTRRYLTVEAQALACGDLEESYRLWQQAQWDGTDGVTQDGDIPWVWLVNIDHLYWVRDGLTVAEQKIHPHGHGWSIVNNVDQWSWKG